MARKDDAEDNARQDIMRQAVMGLLEHFSSIQIVATHHDDSRCRTSIFSEGKGDMFARMGAARTWLDVEMVLLRGEGDGL